MELYLNELSLHGQFGSVADFQKSLQRVMELRQLARQNQRDVYTCRNLANQRIISSQQLIQVLQQLSPEVRISFTQWASVAGPFWEDNRLHDANEFFECFGQIVTDSTIGEVSWRKLSGKDARTIAFDPSNYALLTIEVSQLREGREPFNIQIDNYCQKDDLEKELKACQPEISSWEEMDGVSRERFCSLAFCDEWTVALRRQPFVRSACRRYLDLLLVLDKLKAMHQQHRTFTEEMEDMITQYFTGDRAWFSDSSTTEISTYRNALTFKCPGTQGNPILCRWHGKVSSPVMRLHFSWPLIVDQPLYIAYAGPKITKK